MKIISLPGLTFARLQYDGTGTGRSVRKVTKNTFQYSVNVPESKDKNLLINKGINENKPEQPQTWQSENNNNPVPRVNLSAENNEFVRYCNFF